MSPDAARVEDTQAWPRKALLDLDSARVLLDAHPPLLGNAAYHSQQAAEKAFKAFLAWQDEPLHKTHNLEEIGRRVAASEPSINALVDRAAELTEYAWKYRYPGPLEEPSREEAEETLALAREVYDTILARLPEEVRP